MRVSKLLMYVVHSAIDTCAKPLRILDLRRLLLFLNRSIGPALRCLGGMTQDMWGSAGGWPKSFPGAPETAAAVARLRQVLTETPLHHPPLLVRWLRQPSAVAGVTVQASSVRP